MVLRSGALAWAFQPVGGLGMAEPESGHEGLGYVIGQDNISGRIHRYGFDIHNPVFVISAGSIVVFVLVALAFPAQAATAFGWLRTVLTRAFDGFFIAAANLFVLFCLLLMAPPWGRIKIGGPDAAPDFSFGAWFAMLFAAGVGIGLMFFGVLEPVFHMGVSQPLGVVSPFGADGGIAAEQVAQAKAMGLGATLYHWGLHPWAVYGVVALALGLAAYNGGLPFTIRSAFHPLFGDRVWGWVGHIIDTLAVFATLFGLATSLGLGAQQASAGLNHVFGTPATTAVQVVLIIAITAIALTSVVRGMERGVKVLSQINVALAGLLLLFVLFAGPTLRLLTDFALGVGTYLREIAALSNPVGRTDDVFRQDWTAFYWAWWIAWSPFVGMFIARVSRGRTVRQFIACVLLAPTLISALWVAVFGGVAIDQVLSDPDSAVRAHVIDGYNLPIALFAMLEGLPLASITAVVSIVLVIVFFVTSSDSGSLVVDSITAGGKLDAPLPQRVFWCIFQGAVAIALLLGGGLEALQAMVISIGLPFTLVLLLMCASIFRSLQRERHRSDR